MGRLDNFQGDLEGLVCQLRQECHQGHGHLVVQVDQMGIDYWHCNCKWLALAFLA